MANNDVQQSLFQVGSFTKDLLGQAQRGHYARHEALLSNLANVDTPGYKALDVSFEGMLRERLAKARGQQAGDGDMVPGRVPPDRLQQQDARHFTGNDRLDDGKGPMDAEAFKMSWRNDRNGVDVETEMVLQTQNAQRYVALAKIDSMMTRRFRSVLSQNNP